MHRCSRYSSPFPLTVQPCMCAVLKAASALRIFIPHPLAQGHAHQQHHGAPHGWGTISALRLLKWKENLPPGRYDLVRNPTFYISISAVTALTAFILLTGKPS